MIEAVRNVVSPLGDSFECGNHCGMGYQSRSLILSHGQKSVQSISTVHTHVDSSSFLSLSLGEQSRAADGKQRPTVPDSQSPSPKKIYVAGWLGLRSAHRARSLARSLVRSLVSLAYVLCFCFCFCMLESLFPAHLILRGDIFCCCCTPKPTCKIHR